MSTSNMGDAKRGFKSEKENPWRVAPRLKEEVRNKGIHEKKKPKQK